MSGRIPRYKASAPRIRLVPVEVHKSVTPSETEPITLSVSIQVGLAKLRVKVEGSAVWLCNRDQGIESLCILDVPVQATASTNEEPPDNQDDYAFLHSTKSCPTPN